MYRHRFHTRAALDAVAAFHRRSASMAAITPPPLRVTLHSAPAELGEGDEMDFSLRLGPLPLALRWLARIEAVGPGGFTDRQISGPFRRWVHVHRFVTCQDGTVAVLDEVDAQPAAHLVWGPVGWAMKLSLPFLFAFRARRTRRLLEGRA